MTFIKSKRIGRTSSIFLVLFFQKCGGGFEVQNSLRKPNSQDSDGAPPSLNDSSYNQAFKRHSPS